MYFFAHENMKETPSKVGHFSEIAEIFSTTAKNFQYLVKIFALLIIIPDAFFDWKFPWNSYLLRPEKLKIEKCTLYFKFWELWLLKSNILSEFFTIRILVKEANGIENYLTIQIRIPVGKATLIVKIRGQLIIGLFFSKPHVDSYNSIE